MCENERVRERGEKPTFRNGPRFDCVSRHRKGGTVAVSLPIALPFYLIHGMISKRKVYFVRALPDVSLPRNIG